MKRHGRGRSSEARKPRARAPRSIARAQRPRKFRHWPADDIGSDSWWRQVRKLRVQRAEVETTLRIAAAGGDLRSIDPHDLQPGESAAERAVTYILTATYVPTYASFMYVVHVWNGAGRSLKEWIVAQYAQLIDGSDERQREAALYSLWVDYFEVPERAAFVFPRLLAQVRRRADLLVSSGPIAWAAKRAAYQAAARDPALHAALARGLAGSFFDVFGSVEPVEARDLFTAITVEDLEVRAALQRVTTEPTRWRVLAVIRVDESDERWRRWLHAGSGTSFLVRLQALGRPRWVPGSELVHNGHVIGRLRHWGFPFDAAIRHEVQGSLGEVAGATVVLFRVEGDAAAVRAALGDDVEAWPFGLRPG